MEIRKQLPLRDVSAHNKKQFYSLGFIHVENVHYFGICTVFNIQWIKNYV